MSTNDTLECKVTIRAIENKVVLATVDATLRFTGMDRLQRGQLYLLALDNGLKVKAQSKFRAAVLATRKEGYEGPTIKQIVNAWKVRTLDVTDLLSKPRLSEAEKAKRDADKSIDKMSDDEAIALLERKLAEKKAAAKK